MDFGVSLACRYEGNTTVIHMAEIIRLAHSLLSFYRLLHVIYKIMH